MNCFDSAVLFAVTTDFAEEIVAEYAGSILRFEIGLKDCHYYVKYLCHNVSSLLEFIGI